MGFNVSKFPFSCLYLLLLYIFLCTVLDKQTRNKMVKKFDLQRSRSNIVMYFPQKKEEIPSIVCSLCYCIHIFCSISHNFCFVGFSLFTCRMYGIISIAMKTLNESTSICESTTIHLNTFIK